MPVQAKICGIKDEASVTAVVDAGAAYIGFVFYDKSPRNLSFEKAAQLQKLVPSAIKTVAVTVDPSDQFIGELIKSGFAPNYLQLHGNESVARVAEIKDKYPFKIIKAFKVSGSDDIAKAKQYEDFADIFLFDARDSAKNSLPGGNGLSFDWNLLKHQKFNIPWMLSGGLNKDNISVAIAITNAQIIDASSGLEIKAGVKDPVLIKDFLDNLRAL